MRRLPTLSLVVLLTGCGNDCVDMCQQYARWVEACGTDWETTFPKRDWSSVEDCYDAHWDVDDDRRSSCASQAESWASKECY